MKRFFLLLAVIMILSACATQKREATLPDFQKMLDLQIGKDGVRNSILAIDSGSLGFNWSGASGQADPEAGITMAADTLIHAASVGKMFTACAIARLVEKKKLSFDAKIGDILPESIVDGLHILNGKDYSGDILVRQLLNHSSGLADFLYDTTKTGETFLELAMAEPERIWTVEQTLTYAKEGFDPLFAPGEGFHYSDTNYILLGLILEKLSGIELSEVYRQNIFEPVGMAHTRLWFPGLEMQMAHLYFGEFDMTMNKALLSSAWSSGGCVTTVNDLQKFMRALASGKIVSKEVLSIMCFGSEKYEEGINYGFGIMSFDFPKLDASLEGLPPIWGHPGTTGSFCYYCPAIDTVICGTLNQQETERSHLMLVIDALIVVLSGTSS